MKFVRGLSAIFVLIAGSCAVMPPDDDLDVRSFNILVFITDDQRWDSMFAMPITEARLSSSGVVFTSAYATTPVCCPFRASFISGGFYAQHTEILANGPPNGGWRRFDNARSMAVRLQQAGYRTGFVGKYMNGFLSMRPPNAPVIPPGWSYFAADDHERRPDDWFITLLVEGASEDAPTEGIQSRLQDAYITDAERDKALEFLRRFGEEQFFLMVSFRAPHAPAIPAEEDRTSFSDFVHRSRAWGEEDTSDKSSLTRAAGRRDLVQRGARDEFQRNQLRTLRAVDRAVAAIFDELEAQNLVENTAVFFTSDNGLHWGEHNLLGKGQPYEESIRIPFLAALPGGLQGTYDGLVAANLDMPATILDMAGLTNDADGRSLLPILLDESTAHRDRLFFEVYEKGDGSSLVWSAIIQDEAEEMWKLIEFQTGERELYELTTDPFEERSRHQRAEDEERLTELSAELAGFKGLAILDRAMPDGQVGVPYRHEFSKWGGSGAFLWEVASGELPASLSLDAATGVLSGTPQTAGAFAFDVRLSSQQLARYTGRPQAHIVSFELAIAE